jgi:EAL domain-containing protein (putative c-di-GMP-specific phosphodiesterase class I)
MQAQAQQILGVLQQPLPLSNGNGSAGTAELTVHVGGAVWPDDSTVLITLIENARIALRRALRRSRGDCEWFDMRRARNVLHRHDRADELRRAFERDEFGLVFQPEFDRTGGRVLGAEALLRWTDASGRTHAPRNFVPLLEEAGLIQSIGDHTLQTACSMAQSWQREEGVSLQISVNLAPQQLIDRQFAKRVTHILDQTGFPAHRLELEIAEESFVKHAEEAARGLRELADVGVRLLLDDCGAGSLSISCLKTLPLSGIKIDRSVIAGIERNNHDCALIKAMIDLALSLDLNVVGEGVESVMQALTLGAMGIGRMQGYLFAPGLPHEEFAERFLRPFDTE